MSSRLLKKQLNALSEGTAAKGVDQPRSTGINKKAQRQKLKKQRKQAQQKQAPFADPKAIYTKNLEYYAKTSAAKPDVQAVMYKVSFKACSCSSRGAHMGC